MQGEANDHNERGNSTKKKEKWRKRCQEEIKENERKEKKLIK